MIKASKSFSMESNRYAIYNSIINSVKIYFHLESLTRVHVHFVNWSSLIPTQPVNSTPLPDHFPITPTFKNSFGTVGQSFLNLVKCKMSKL